MSLHDRRPPRGRLRQESVSWEVEALLQEQEAREAGLIVAGRRALALLALIPAAGLGDHAKAAQLVFREAARCGWEAPPEASILAEPFCRRSRRFA